MRFLSQTFCGAESRFTFHTLRQLEKAPNRVPFLIGRESRTLPELCSDGVRIPRSGIRRSAWEYASTFSKTYGTSHAIRTLAVPLSRPLNRGFFCYDGEKTELFPSFARMEFAYRAAVSGVLRGNTLPLSPKPTAIRMLSAR